MRILLTNDDGVHAPGLMALHRAFKDRHQVTVVAPDTEQSAVGHAITLTDPIRVRRLEGEDGLDGWAVSGTPADCVKLALHELLPQSPELVLSGINLGANLGVNLLYSGTVSAASEAALQGITGLAFSLGTLHRPDFSFAARFAAHLVERLPGLGLPPGTPLNVNIPALAPERIKGVRLVRQSHASLRERFIRRSDPRGHVYYWQAGETMDSEDDLSLDYPAHLAGYVTVTPLRLDLTDEELLQSPTLASLDLP